MVVETTTERGIVSADPLKFALSPGETLASTLFTREYASLPVGARLEVCPDALSIAATIARLVGGPSGGAGLVIDYGGDTQFGNSFRGFRQHQLVDPLSQPGDTDLTANVDFSRLRTALSEHGASSIRTVGADVSPVTVEPLVTQQRFLSSLGLGDRVERLVERMADEAQADALLSAALRLVDSTGMGTQYKVLAFTAKPAASYTEIKDV